MTAFAPTRPKAISHAFAVLRSERTITLRAVTSAHTKWYGGKIIAE
jgi:hypothetical protein